MRVVKKEPKAATDHPAPTGDTIAAINIAVAAFVRRINDENRRVMGGMAVQLPPADSVDCSGGLSKPWRESDEPLMAAWSRHPGLCELTSGDATLALNSACAATGKSGGEAAADSKKTKAAKSKKKAISRFKLLIATGRLDASEAISQMAT